MIIENGELARNYHEEQREYIDDDGKKKSYKAHFIDLTKHGKDYTFRCQAHYKQEKTYVITDRNYSAYRHWVDMFHNGHIDMINIDKIFKADGLSYLFDESDFIKKDKVKTESFIPQTIKDDVNDAARKKDAHELISKYFNIGKDAASGD